MDLGDGYELTYGQLGNIDLKEGDYMDYHFTKGKFTEAELEKAKAALQEEYQDFEDDHHDEYDRDL